MISLAQLAADVAVSGLVDAKTLDRVLKPKPPDRPPPDAQAAANLLVSDGVLTAYQAAAFLQGKGKSLVLDQYVVLEKLGQGGMGIVLKARHRQMKRLVAIKVIAPAAMKSPQAVLRFKREVEAAAQLTHTNIVAAHDYREFLGYQCLIMEFVEGKDLSAIVKEQGPLPLEKAVDYILQAARGLACAHGRQIIHRDIKPANLLLSKEGCIKILDMGLARFEHQAADADRLTGTDQVMGTVDYMAPEQARNTHQADGRADIYSLGCTLYRLLTGKSPFSGGQFTETLLKHQEAPIPSLMAAREDVPYGLEQIYLRMMAKQPGDRQQSMSELVGELEAYLKEQAEDSSEGLSYLREVFTQAEAERAARPKPQKRPPPVWLRPEVLLPAVLAVCGMAAVLVWLALRPGGSARPRAAEPQVAAQPRVAQPPSAAQAAPPPAVAPLDAAKAKEHQAAWAKHLGVPVEMTNSIGMKLVLIPPGEFDMGSPEEEQDWVAEAMRRIKRPQADIDRVQSEVPQHQVRISRPFFVGVYEVTQAEYQRVTGINPSSFADKQIPPSAFQPPLSKAEIDFRSNSLKKVAGQDTSRHPVEMLSWEDAMDFCRRLSALPEESNAHRVYRLPTEAEWEYTCRAGTTTRWSYGDNPAAGWEHAWFQDNASDATQPVGRKKPNAWGLFDMHGNLSEYCADWFEKGHNSRTATVDPAGPPTGTNRVVRGSGFSSQSVLGRSASRHHSNPTARTFTSGFRVVCEVSKTLARTDPDRQVAEWVLGQRGTLQIRHEGEIKGVANKDRLPETPFTLITISHPSTLTDIDLARLEPLSELDRLVLGGSTLPKDGLKRLPQLTGLRCLTVGGTKVTDADLANVVRLPRLELLDLTNTKISDEGLKRLESLSGLRELRLKEVKQITPAAVAALQKALPKCKIEWDGGAIGLQADPERRAAEWVLSVGGKLEVSVDGKPVLIGAVEELPSGPFEVTSIDFNACRKAKVVDADLERLQGLSSVNHICFLGVTLTDEGLIYLAGRYNRMLCTR